MSDIKEYETTDDGFFMGDWHKKGTPLKLTDKQAQYGLQDGTLKLKGKAKAAKTTTKADSKA